MEEKKKLDYSRLNVLMNKVNEFINTLPADMKDDAFNLLLFAHDAKNKVTATYIFGEAEDMRASLVECIDNCITGAALKGAKEQCQEWEIVNALGEYMMKLCAMFPGLYENFKQGVEHYKEDRNETK